MSESTFVSLKEHYFNVDPMKLLVKVDTAHPDYDKKKMVSKDEQSKLASIIRKMKHDPASNTHYLNVSYKVPEYNKCKQLGRMYSTPHTCYQNMYNPIRRLVIDGNLYSLDIENAQPMLLYQLCSKAGYNAVGLGLYAENREEIIKTLMDHYSTSRAVVKNLFVRMCFGGTPETWSHAYFEANRTHPKSVLDFHMELTYIKEEVASRFSKWGDAYTHYGVAKKKKVDGVIAVYLQNVERQCMCVARAVLKAEGIEVVSLIHDEVLTRQEVETKVIKKVQEGIFYELGFALNFSRKQMLATAEDKAWLASHEGVLRDEPVVEDDYDSVKAEFEEHAFFLFDHSAYATVKENGVLLVDKLPAFNNKYRALKYKKVVYKEGQGNKDDFSFMPRWLDDEKKRTYDSYDFFPPPCSCDEKVFNTWTGLKIEQTHADVEPTDARDLLDLVKVLANNDAESYEYILNWLAHIIQSPGAKCGTALVLKSKQGAGKGNLVDIMRMILGKQFVGETANPTDDIFGTHGTLHIGKLLVCLDEVKSKDTAKNLSRLKNLITADTASHNGKGAPLVEVRNNTRFIFTTNESLPVSVEGDDRRMCLIECSDIRCKDNDFWKKFREKLTRDRGMILAFYLFLKDRDLTKVNWTDLPKTELRSDIIGSSAHPIVFWLDEFMSETKEFLTRDEISFKAKDLHDSYNAYCIKKSQTGISNSRAFGTIFGDRIQKFVPGVVKRKSHGVIAFTINKHKVLGWLKENDYQ